MIDLSNIKSPVILAQTETRGYRDPAVFYHEGVYYLYVTMAEQKEDGTHVTIGMSKSTDLVHWSEPKSIVAESMMEKSILEEVKEAEYSNPGNMVLFQGKYYLCMQVAYKETEEANGQKQRAIAVMETTDFEQFKAPVILRVKGEQASEDEMEQITDAFLVQDKEEADKIWCFYKQNQVSYSYSYSYDMEHWTYAGSVECGENACIIVKEDNYYLMHSFENGIGLKISKDFKQFYDAGPANFLSQSKWEWAKDRITAGFLLDLTREPEIRGYFMFYHGENHKNGSFPLGASIGMAFTKDLKHYVTFENEEPTYPKLGNIYEGDYYKDLPFDTYIDTTQAIPESGNEVPIFDIREYGAVPVPERINTAAIQSAVDACHEAGGGVVLVAGGRYVSGTIRLYSNITLHIAVGAVLEATRENGRIKTAFLVAENAEQVTVTGGGTVYGNGEWYVYEPKLKPRLTPLEYSHLAKRGTENNMLPETTLRYQYRRRIRFSEDKYEEGIGPTTRPSYMVYFKNCQKVKLENIILKDAMAWTLNLFACQNVLVKNVVIDNNRHVANTDGIDVTGSSQVELDHCFVSTADDGIVLKNPEETNRDMSDIYVHDCEVITVMNSFKIGTETRWDVSKVLVENCHFFMPDIYPGTTSGIAIESSDGSLVSDIVVRNITMDKVTCPIFVCLNMRNRYGIPTSFDPSCRCWGGTIEKVKIESIRAVDAEVPSLLFGFETVLENGTKLRKPISDICVKDVKVVYKDNKELVDVPETIEEYLYDYPENNSFGDVDAYGFWARHADNLVFEQIEVVPRSENTREMIQMYDVKTIG